MNKLSHQPRQSRPGPSSVCSSFFSDSVGVVNRGREFQGVHCKKPRPTWRMATFLLQVYHLVSTPTSSKLSRLLPTPRLSLVYARRVPAHISVACIAVVLDGEVEWHIMILARGNESGYKMKSVSLNPHDLKYELKCARKAMFCRIL